MGNLNYPNLCYDENHQVNGGVSTATLPVRGYAHHPAPQSPAPQPRVPANHAPLGLFSVASTLFVVCLNAVLGRGPSMPNAFLSLICIYGGLTQYLVGMWDYAGGNTFGAIVFLSYGSFWLAYGTFLNPFLGIASTYAGDSGDLSNSLGVFLAAWFIITFIFLLGTMKTNIVMVLLFFFLEFTYLFFMISEFTGSTAVHKAGGWAGLATAAASFYAGAAQLLTRENFLFDLPVGDLHQRLD